MRSTLLLVTVGLLLTGCLEEVEPISTIDNTAMNYAVTLVWQPPIQNSDGSPIMDLAGYHIYVGKQSNSYDRKIRLDNPGLTAYVVEGLGAGTYYFAATAFNTSGIESRLSGEVAKTFN